jgi:hypothetical protein
MFAVGYEFRQQADGAPQRTVALARDALEKARRAKNLLPDRAGRYRSKEVKAAFPSQEGRGKGQGRQKAGMWADQIRWLGWYFLTTPKPKGWDWQAHFDWCKDIRLATSKKHYQALRPAALKFAENELASRVRAGVGIVNARKTLFDEEAATHEANIRSWKQRGRPRTR